MIHNIFSNAELSEEQLAIIENRLKYVSVDKGELLLRESQPVPNQYYVLKGCLRTYHIDNTGKEHTIQFAINDWWISDYTAFFTGGVSSLNIECIQDAELVVLSRESMEKLYTEVPAVETYFRIKMERFFASFQKRILSNLSSTAKERYIGFINTYPNIEALVKNYHIASYLGITTESLSRIRKEMAR